MVDPRWRTVVTVTPFVVIGLLVAFTVGIEWGRWSLLVPNLVLCGVTVMWMILFRSLGLRWTNRPWAIALFLAGMIILNLVLVLREGYFGFLAIATFMYAYSLVAWPWEPLAVGATAVVAGIAQSSSFAADAVFGVIGTVVVVLLNVGIMCGMSWGLELATRMTQREGVEAERARLAREIHDTLAQEFAGIITQLQAAEQAPDDGARDRHTASALELAREGLAEARRSVQALRPSALESARLPEALANVARSWTTRTGIPVDIRTRGRDRLLSTEAEVVLLRTAQEALSNIERHAAARQVTLVLQYGPRNARIEVRDDGCGFDPAQRRDELQSGYGLIAMRERVEALAGALVIESGPGTGTAVTAEVPA